jgi:hypothetical protein
MEELIIPQPQQVFRDEHTIVPPNEAVAILGHELSLEGIFLRLLHGNVQISVETAENAPVFHAGIQAHANRPAQETLQKVGGRLREKRRKRETLLRSDQQDNFSERIHVP